MRISDWSSDVCSSDLPCLRLPRSTRRPHQGALVEWRRHVPVGQTVGGWPLRVAGSRVWSRTSDPRAAVDAVGRYRLAPPSTHLSSHAGLKDGRSEEHTSELQSLMRISYAVFCLKKTKNK